MSSAIEELKSEMRTLMDKIAGLNTIVITDSCGVPLIKVNKSESNLSSSSNHSHHNNTQDTTRASMMSSFSQGADQANKLGIGLCRTMTCVYENYQIVHFNKSPLVVGLIANVKANTGLLLSLEHEFDSVCLELNKCVQCCDG